MSGLSSKQVVRRKRALFSYLLVVAQLAYFLGYFVPFADAQMVANLGATAIPLGGINVTLAGLIGQYHHHAQQADLS